jgi:hypothetical protein
MTSRTTVFDFLIWVPAAFYALLFAKATAFDAFDRAALDLLFPALAFVVLAGAHRAQSRRLRQLEQAMQQAGRGNA